MILDDLLGKTLEEALADMRAEGIEPDVVQSVAPRAQRSGGTLRVVRVQPGKLTVCAFMDDIPTA